MPNKTYFWSDKDIAAFLRENDFNFMKGANGSNGAWVKLNHDGEPGVMFEFKFKRDRYCEKEINRIIRLSEIPEKRWQVWFDARSNEGDV